jgi:hypothetical protein
MREIHLTHGKITKVDDEDFARLSAFAWSAVRAAQGRENWYARRQELSADRAILNIYMHRDILGIEDTEIEADHKDRDGLNNQRSNLRKCTRQLNCANIIYDTPASGYRGVYLHRKGRWRAQVTVRGKTKNLGLFGDPMKAAHVRDAYVFELYGEFAVLNFPLDRVAA